MPGTGMTWLVGKCGGRRPRPRSIDHLRSGVWLVLFFTFLYVADYLGSFGTDVITAPWDSIIVFLGSLAFYWWGVNAGARHMADHPLAPAEQRVPDDGELSPLAH
ncbi:hypothetical protein ABZ490_24315 [Streptomyces sp. NPDC005811]|uniref:hypothetical protein n=1 Tax=Streptomyces sp. NPDC005811 TaxID=3154565 RepID=UPI0033C93269